MKAPWPRTTYQRRAADSRMSHSLAPAVSLLLRAPSPVAPLHDSSAAWWAGLRPLPFTPELRCAAAQAFLDGGPAAAEAQQAVERGLIEARPDVLRAAIARVAATDAAFGALVGALCGAPDAGPAAARGLDDDGAAALYGALEDEERAAILDAVAGAPALWEPFVL